MKIKLLAILTCIFTISALCYAVSNSQDGLTKTERQYLSTFFKKMQTCQNVKLTAKNGSFKAYKSGSLCIYEESNALTQKSMRCEFPLNVAKTFAQNGLKLNNDILNNTVTENPFNDKAIMENVGLATKYCK